MSHQIVVEFDAPTFRMEAICTYPEGAECRTAPDFKECFCEEYTVEQDERGYYHEVRTYNEVIGDLPQEDLEGTERHYHHPVDYCGEVLWLNESDIEECGQGQSFEVGRFPIKLHWVGPGYDWEKAS